MKNFLILSFVFLQSLTAVHASRLPVSVCPPSAQGLCNPSSLILELTLLGYGHHQVSWPVTSGTGNYNLTVVNMATNQIHSSVSTPNTSTIIAGLTTGSYRFSLSRGASIIVTEVINL